MASPELELVLQAISRGEISRVEAARRLGIDLPFGDMLGLLREHNLPLPRFPVNRASPGFRLVVALAARDHDAA